MALTAVDTMAAPDVVGVDMTVAADTGAVAMTVADVLIAPQAHTPSGPDKCPDQDAIDRAKPGIVNHYVTGDMISVGDKEYN